MKKERMIITVLFAAFITVPLLFQCFSIEINYSDSENRKLQPFPEFTFGNTMTAARFKGKIIGLYRDVMSFKNKFNLYYQDNFILKRSLFETYKIIQINLFHESALPKKAVLGNDGWYFLGDSYSNVILESKGISHFSDEELRTIWQILIERQNWLSAKGIGYFVAVAPNKETVYGSYLPIIKNEKTKLKQLKGFLDSSPVHFIDLSLLYEFSDKDILYYKTDSHWSDLGAFWAYKALINKINESYPDVKSLSLNDFTSKSEVNNQQDLIKMLNLNVEEYSVKLTIKSPKSHQLAPVLQAPADTFGYEERFKCDANSLKVLVFRDSFGSAIKSFIKESFGESVFIWSHSFDKQLIEQENPDIVIHILAERSLDDAFLD